VEPVIATPQSNHAVPNLPILEAEVTVLLSSIRFRSLSNDVCVGQPVGSTTGRVWHILISGVGVRLHIGIVVQRTQLQFCRTSVKLHPLVASDFAIRFGAALLGTYLVEASRKDLGMFKKPGRCSLRNKSSQPGTDMSQTITKPSGRAGSGTQRATCREK